MARQKTTGEVRLNGEKSYYLSVVEKKLFPKWMYGGMFAANVEVIWQMPGYNCGVQEVSHG